VRLRDGCALLQLRASPAQLEEDRIYQTKGVLSFYGCQEGAGNGGFTNMNYLWLENSIENPIQAIV